MVEEPIEILQPVMRQVEEMNVVLQAVRKYTQLSGRAVHHSMASATAAHWWANGQHTHPEQEDEQ